NLDELAGYPNSLVAESMNQYMLRMSLLLAAFQQIGNGTRLLDLGTNCGMVPLFLAKKMDISGVGIDVSDINAKKSRFLANLGSVSSFRFVTGDGLSYLGRQQSDSFDAISALGVFYHFSNPLGYLAE